MGFCRRCGEIVIGERCRCGGLPVEPIVAFRKDANEPDAQDKWTKTYASSKGSTSPARSTTPFQPNRDARLPERPTSSSPTKRFPRPATPSSSRNSVVVGSRVTDYIASTTSRPRSPLKHSITGPNPEAGILPSLTPNDTTLSKVYGSVLQPKETLATFSCAICSSAFPPDATIYPDPMEPNSSHRFLCRPCFVENGGSKGPCGTCSRPVLTLKSDGGFIHAADKFWHKRCFNCAGCCKNIGDSPMVDLLGQPCCPNCFDNCLKRETPKKKKPVHTESPNPESLKKLGRLSLTSPASKSRESSPVIGELEERLGVRRRESSPALEELSHRLNTIGKDISSRYAGDSPSASPTPNRSRNSRGSLKEDEGRLSLSTSHSPTRSTPVRPQTPGSPAPRPEAVEEMKQRLLKAASHTPPTARTKFFPSIHSPSSRDRVRLSQSSSTMSDVSVSPHIPPIPDLVSDFSDTLTQSSFSEPDSPPRIPNDDDIFNSSKAFGSGYGTRYKRNDYFNPLDGPIVEETNSQLNTPTKTPTRTPNKSQDISNTPVKSAGSIPTSSPLRHKSSNHSIRKPSTPSSEVKTPPAACAKCRGRLFTKENGGSYITVPSDEDGSPRRYHPQCFTCHICNDAFEKGSNGQATFVKYRGNACHPECAPKERMIVHKSPSSPALRTSISKTSTRPTPSPTPAHSKPVISSRFEQSAITASTSEGPLPRFGGRNACPGCKKAVSPMERGVIPGPQGSKWHSSCLVCGGKKQRPISWYGRDPDEKGKPGCGKKLDSAAKTDGDGGVWCRECILLLGIHSSPQPSPSKTPLSPTYTGSGKMIPQFTGTTTIARQFTGMGSGEAALLRQLTGGGLNPTRSISPTKQLGVRPRPKSVIGMRSGKSVDEGRGMFLVRQLTGASSSGWNDS